MVTQTGDVMLNGKPYYLRGSNVTCYRFFEDAARGDLPWRGEWVRTLHQRFKSMHWNSLRYCIGFPPEAWYDIADEEGFLYFVGRKDDMIKTSGYRVSPTEIEEVLYGSGRVAEPGFSVVAAGNGEIRMPPVSVCHQVSTIGQRLSPTTR